MFTAVPPVIYTASCCDT